MNAGDLIYALLHDTVAIEALVGTRIAPQISAQSDDVPRIVYEITDTEDTGHLRGSSNLTKRSVTINSFAGTQTAAQALADLVKGTLDGHIGAAGGVNCRGIKRSDERDDHAAPQPAEELLTPYVQQTFTVWIEE